MQAMQLQLASLMGYLRWRRLSKYSDCHIIGYHCHLPSANSTPPEALRVQCAGCRRHNSQGFTLLETIYFGKMVRY